MKNLFDLTKNFVDDSFGEEKAHFVRAAYWAEKFAPNNEALKIAAYAHDIERAFKKGEDRACFLLEPEALEKHQNRGGEIMYHFLINNDAQEELALTVRKLIEKHEVGGTEEQNMLMDADSISYFETNAPRHIGWDDRFTKQEIRSKFDRMYNRISSEERKQIARPLYQRALEILEETR